jgi:hypothetical protein
MVKGEGPLRYIKDEGQRGKRSVGLDKDRLQMYGPWTIMSKRLPNQI